MEDERGENRITETIIGAAIAVHKHLGPGLLESSYEACLAFEMADGDWRSNGRRNYRLSIGASESIARIEWTSSSKARSSSN